MSIHIKNFVLTLPFILAIPSSIFAETKPAVAQSQGRLVFEHDSGSATRMLESITPAGTDHQVLRSKFSAISDWDISRDGSKICFGAWPTDIENAVSNRWNRFWLFSMPFNGRPSVVLAPYGPKRDGKNFYDYTLPSWSIDGSKIIYTEGDRDEYSYSYWLSTLDLRTKRKIWNSRTLEKTLPNFITRQNNVNYFRKQLYGGKMSPDGRHLICFAKSSAMVYSDAGYAEKDWKTYLLHFDLVQNKVGILSQFDLGRLTTSEGKLAWNPDNIHFAFSLAVRDKAPNAEIFLGDWKTRNIRRLTIHPAQDRDPIWINKGKQIAWLSDRIHSSRLGNRIFVMNANGTHQRQILKKLTGISNLRYVDKLPEWGRYKNMDTTPISRH